MNFAILLTSGFVVSGLLATLGAYSQYVLQRAGVFSASPPAFMGIGGYLYAHLATKQGMSAPLAVLLAVAVCAVLGGLVGVLIGKLRGAYQAIGTLSVVLVVQQIALGWTSVTGGALGIYGIPVWAELGTLLAITGLVVLVVVAFELSRHGAIQEAIRMDEVAAASVGINVATSRIVAMVLSAAIAGLAGAAFAGNVFAIDPSAFGFALVISLLSAVVIGGYRTIIGPPIGAFIVIALPLVLSRQALISSIIVGLATILILRFFPRGIAALVPFSSKSLRTLVAGRRGGGAETGTGPLEALRGLPAGDLTASGMSRSYGSVRAVHGVSLQVSPGQIVGLIGPNGAGKTSVINMLAGITALDAGEISLGERRVHEEPAYRVARHGIVRTFQACRLFSELSVLENVTIAAEAAGSRHGRRGFAAEARSALAMVGCGDLVDRRAGVLSYADQRRVEIARALATGPSYVLLDEPAAGMVDSEAAQLAEVIRKVAEVGVGVLVVDHNVNWIFSLCDHVYVQNLGVLIASGAPGEVRSNPAVIEAYIGASRGDSHVAS